MILRSRIRRLSDVVLVYAAVLVIVAVAPLVLSPVKSPIHRAFVRYAVYIVMAGVPVAACRFRKQPLFEACGFKRDGLLKQILTAVPVFAVSAGVFVALPLLLGVPKSALLDVKYTDPAEIALRVIQYMVFVGPVEELIFRGYLFERLKKLTDSDVWTVILTSVAFGLWHFPGSLDILRVMVASFIGLIFGLARLKLKNCSTLSAALAHGLHDTFIMALSCLLLP